MFFSQHDHEDPVADCDYRSLFWRKVVRWGLTLGCSTLALFAVFYVAGFFSSETSSPRAGKDSSDALDVPGGSVTDPQQMSVTEIDNPANDGWPTEVFNNSAKKQLKTLVALLTQKDAPSAQTLAPLVTGNFYCTPLLPIHRETVFKDNDFHIQRAVADSKVAAEDRASAHQKYAKAEGFSKALKSLLSPFSASEALHCKLKTFRVEPAENHISTWQYFSCSGKSKDGMVEQHATWKIRWTKPAPGTAPRMESIEVENFEMTESHRGPESMFVDKTEAVLKNNESYSKQLSWGLNRWLQRTQERRHLLGSPGIAIGDVNGDGLEDIYLCQELGIPNLLFIQNQDGTLDDVSAEWGVDWLQHSRSVLLLDLDNDTDQDLVVGFFGGVLIASNENGKRFKVRTILETSEDVMSLSAADFDNDGDLDLYASAYIHSPNEVASNSRSSNMPGAMSNLVFHDANTGASNSLLRNEIAGDDWAFVDATLETGLTENNSRYSYAAAWEDYDNDGDQDLYVANDFGRDNLFQNTDGQFVDIGDQVGAEDAAAGMGITWGDYNHDGWMDAYISNMWSSAGNRIAFQPQFKTNAPPQLKKRLQRLARGNTLLENQQGQSFRDVSAAADVEVGRWAWSSKFVDLNNDSWEDLVVANGYVTNSDTSDL